MVRKQSTKTPQTDGDALRAKEMQIAKSKAAGIARTTLARNVLRPTVNAAVTINRAVCRDFGDVGLTGLANELEAQCAAVSRGDLGRPEALLIAQTHTLDALFNDLARLAYRNWDSLEVAERLLRLAFKTQAQSRATVETLGILRNPPMVIARQANIAHGPQQVNNESPTRTRENQFEPNKLLEKISGEWLDPRATSEAGGSDSAMATLGAFDRPTKRPGQGKGRTKRR